MKENVAAIRADDEAEPLLGEEFDATLLRHLVVLGVVNRSRKYYNYAEFGETNENY